MTRDMDTWPAEHCECIIIYAHILIVFKIVVTELKTVTVDFYIRLCVKLDI